MINKTVALVLLATSSTGFSMNLLNKGGSIDWNFSFNDIFEKAVSAEKFKNHVTVVGFSTASTQETAERVGQEIGSKFGTREGYQNLVLPNTADLGFMLKPFVDGRVKAAEERAVSEALDRQKKNGNAEATSESVRSRIIFIHDKDGRVWKKFGVRSKDDQYHIGVINKDSSMVYLAKEPIDIGELSDILDKEFNKLSNLTKSP